MGFLKKYVQLRTGSTPAHQLLPRWQEYVNRGTCTSVRFRLESHPALLKVTRCCSDTTHVRQQRYPVPRPRHSLVGSPMTTRITPGVGANLLGQHSAERNQDATAYVGNLDPRVGEQRMNHSAAEFKLSWQWCLSARFADYGGDVVGALCAGRSCQSVHFPAQLTHELILLQHISSSYRLDDLKDLFYVTAGFARVVHRWVCNRVVF